MKRQYPLLSSPIKIGGLVLRNRIISAPMTCPAITKDGHYTQTSVDFYEMRARGGAAVVTASEAIADMETGRFHDRDIDPRDPSAIGPMAEVARGIQRHGAFASLEINHGGMIVMGKRDHPRFGPSATTLDGVPVREMPLSIIDAVVRGFAESAAAAKRAGFDMVLIHAGHGWLIHQFLSPATNRRSDEYGGSTENRARLLLRVLEAVRTAVGEKFPIEVRMSAEEYIPDGYDLSEAVRFAGLIDGKADLIQVSTGSRTGSFFRTHPTMYDARGCNVHYAAEIKKHVKTPVATLGAIDDPDMIEEILANGEADIVEMGRGLLADPFFPAKATVGCENEITHCMRCFTCMAERGRTQTRVCSLNPAIGHERMFIDGIPPVLHPRTVVIAGGGPAGMMAAEGAAQRGHHVILYEKSGRLGGALNCEEIIPFKKDLYRFIASKTAALQRLGVEIRLNEEVTPDLLATIKPDRLVIAVGSEPVIPNLPGIRQEHVLLANDLSSPGFRPGKKVVVLGGGLVGCESGLYLAQTGHDVTVAEAAPEIARDANPDERRALLNAMESASVRIETSTTGIAAKPDGLLCTSGGQERLLPADTLVCAVGQKPRIEEAEALRLCFPGAVLAGDCIRTGNMRFATFSGYYTGLDIL